MIRRTRWRAGLAVLPVVALLLAPAPAVALNGVTITQAPTPLSVGQEEHSAFPGLTRRPDGSMRLVWRQGSDHAASRDGDLRSALSHDHGATWEQVTTLRTGKDYRDPSISHVDGREWLTWFTGDATNPARGAEVMHEWGPSVRVDALPYAATTAPLVKLPDGSLGVAFYGRKAGDPVDTSWLGWSFDGGLTWTTNRITNLIGAGVHTNEPYLVVDGTLTHFFYRWGSADGIGLRTLPNSGGPGVSTQRKILDNASGRPTAIRSSATGALLLVYRRLPDRAAQLAVSHDQGLTWTDGGTLLPSLGGLGMTYAALVETAPGEVFGVVGMEEAGTTNSKLYGFRLAL